MVSLKKIFKPVTLISYADIATFIGAALGFLAITYIIDGTVSSYIVALMLLPISAIIDGMDGALARKFGTKHDYGKYLDSISDSICFGIAPSILIYSLYYDISRGPAIDIIDNDLNFNFRYNIENIVAIFTSLIVLLLSIFRLARFTPISIGLVSLLTVTTIPYAKARAGFRNPILVGILVLVITIILRFFENDLWESMWYLAFALYMSYFALIPLLISNNYFDE